jgi:general secretion pathway protein C
MALRLVGDRSPACTARPRAPPPWRAVTARELDFGIIAAGENHFRVQRAIVAELLFGERRLLAKLYFLPHEQNDRVIGVKLYGIRRGSPWDKLGLRNGDLLRAINGVGLATADEARQAYVELSGANKLSVSLERQGRPTTITYLIQ